jgi:dTDP-4-amino-4,6-dideoxygalactose transaminase
MHASKLINGFEGGYATTNNPELAEILSLTRSFGFKGPDNVVLTGSLDAKLNEIHAAMALAGLDDLESQVLRNRERYDVYKDLLRSVPGVRLLEFDESNRSSYKNIVIEFLNEWPLSRADTLYILNAENILARAYYSHPLHKKQMAYKYVPAELPLTDSLSERYMLLPCGHFVDAADIEQILGFMNFIASNSAQIAERLRTRRLAENEPQ